MFLDEGEGFHAVLALADEMHVGETFQQESQFVACRLFVIDDERVDGHTGVQGCQEPVYATPITHSTCVSFPVRI